MSQKQANSVRMINKISGVPQVKILWTGGFDSSLRMAQLSKFNIAIQPYYLIDSKYRRSVKNELDAIAEITNDILAHPETKCTIMPLVKIEVSELQPDRKISEAYQRLRRKELIGSQYNWLARFAKTNPGLELCIEPGISAKARNCILKLGEVIKVLDGDISYFKIIKEKSDKDIVTVFGDFHFPDPLFEITKLEMIDHYVRLGFRGTINKTWFCHNPVRDEPCGVCTPCKLVIEEGLAFRLSPAGLKRYETDVKFGNYLWFKLLKKIRMRTHGF